MRPFRRRKVEFEECSPGFRAPRFRAFCLSERCGGNGWESFRSRPIFSRAGGVRPRERIATRRAGDERAAHYFAGSLGERCLSKYELLANAGAAEIQSVGRRQFSIRPTPR